MQRSLPTVTAAAGRAPARGLPCQQGPRPLPERSERPFRTAARRGRRPGRPGGAGARARSRRYGDPSAGRGSGSPLLGQNDIARSACAVIVSDGFTPEVGRDRRAVDHVQPRVAVHPVPRVDHPVGRGGADHRPAEDVRGHRDVERLGERAAGRAADLLGEQPGRRLPAGIQVGLGVPWPGPATSRRPSRPRRQRVVSELSTRLHDQGDHRPLRPARAPTASARPAGLPDDAAQPARGPGAGRRRPAATGAAPSRWSPGRSGPARCGSAGRGGTSW